TTLFRSAPLRAPTDFRGKVFGLPSIGGESEITLDLCLAASGVDPGSVERQIVGIGAAVFSLVKEGRIAGYAVSMDMANLLKEQDVNTVVFNPRDFIAAGGQVYATLDVGMKEAVAIRSYLTAIKASVRYILDDASSRYQNVLNLLRSKYSFNGLDNDLVARHSLDEYGQVWLADGPSNVLRTVSTSW